VRPRIRSLKVSLIGQAFNGGLSFLGIATWAHLSNQSTLASVFISLSAIAILVDLVDFGGNSWITREIVHLNWDSRVTWNYLFQKIKIIATFSILLSIGMFLNGRRPILALFISIYPLFILIMSYFQGFCLRTEKYFEAIFAQFLERLCWFFPTVLTQYYKDSLESILLSLIFGSLLSLAYIFLLIQRDSKLESGLLRYRFTIMQTYRSSAKLGFASVISDLYSIDTFLVQAFSSSTQAGGFSLVQKNRNIAVLGFSVFGSKLRLAVSEGKDASRKLFQNEWEILAINIVALLLVYVASPKLIGFFYGPDYLVLNSVMRIGVLAFLCSGLCILLQSHISGSRDDKFMSFFTGLSILFALIAISIGASLSGAMGASIGLLVSFIMQLTVLTLRIKVMNPKFITAESSFR
jgi:O-antigen/teichoic acid export membrane protein